MKTLIYKVFLTLNIFACSLAFDHDSEVDKFANSASIVDAFLTVPELITKYGYPVEEHSIITEDGYNLTAHRIPYGRRCKVSSTRRVIWLQHGLADSSAGWVISGPNRALGYYLADNCYDVWLGNSRGNRYSRRHIKVDPDKDKTEFWSFSFNEFGLYDIPASIDYVLNVTKADSLYFAGHSMGTTALFVCLSEKPKYNSKIRLFSALAPGAYISNVRSPPMRILAPFENILEQFLASMGVFEIRFSPQTGQLLGQTLCRHNSSTQKFCEQLLYETTGADPEQMDSQVLSIATGHYPGGNSVRTFSHTFQLINSGKFRKFDFGRARNLKVYGTPEPPDYSIENVAAPVAIYFGENDLLSVKPDLEILASRLPNLKGFYPIKHKKYAHHDFLLAKDNLELLNRPLLKFMKGFFLNKQ